MKHSFQRWLGHAFLLTLLTALIFIVLKYLELTVGTATLWVSGVVIYWVLSGLVILPWNVYFAAEDVLEEIRKTEEKKGKVEEQDRVYALRTRKRACFLAIFLHLGTALIFFTLAYFTDTSKEFGQICYIAAAAALALTGLRPAIHTVEHVLARLGNIRDRVFFPRNDVYELKDRVNKMEHYDTTAKELQESFDRFYKDLDKSFHEKTLILQEAADKHSQRVRELEQMILHIQKNIIDKIDSFNDAVAFKTAWERLVPELARIFRSGPKKENTLE